MGDNSDSSELSMARNKSSASALKLTPSSIMQSRWDNSESDNQTSQGSRSHKSLPKPKVTVLEQLSFDSNVEGNISHSETDDDCIRTATTLDSTRASMITAVLRELRDDIVHSPAIYSPRGVLALVNDGEKSVAATGEDNMVYVQGKTKFTSVPREKALSYDTKNHLWPYYTSKFSDCSSLDVAITIQKFFTPISSICFGLLGGVALLQIIMVIPFTYFLPENTHFARVPMEFGRASCFPAWLVTAVSGLTVIFALSCAPYDDVFISYKHNQTQFQDQMKTQELVSEWKVLNGLRCLLALTGWFIYSITSPPDLLLQHLNDVKQYIHSAP